MILKPVFRDKLWLVQTRCRNDKKAPVSMDHDCPGEIDIERFSEYIPWWTVISKFSLKRFWEIISHLWAAQSLLQENSFYWVENYSIEIDLNSFEWHFRVSFSSIMYSYDDGFSWLCILNPRYYRNNDERLDWRIVQLKLWAWEILLNLLLQSTEICRGLVAHISLTSSTQAKPLLLSPFLISVVEPETQRICYNKRCLLSTT